MKKRNTLLAVILLLGVITLGIGYAAVTKTFTVNGTANVSGLEEDAFNVHYTGTPAVAGEGTTTANHDSDVTATMDVTLTNVGDAASATFTIVNESDNGINASVLADTLTITDSTGAVWSETSSEYFEVEVTGLEDKELAKGDTEDFTVTVTLKKASVEEVTGEKFTVTFDTVSVDA